MHTPWSASKEPSVKVRQDFENSLVNNTENMEGEEDEWEDEWEDEEEDEDLRDWAVKEGIVKDHGPRGFWLEYHEPAEVKATGAR